MVGIVDKKEVDVISLCVAAGLLGYDALPLHPESTADVIAAHAVAVAGEVFMDSVSHSTTS